MAIKNLRDFIEICEAEGELKRVKKEVDWDLELSHISKLNEEKGGPALLFENVKDSIGSVLIGAFTSPRRLAIALGMPLDSSIPDMAREWTKLTSEKLIPPVEVKTGPIMENVVEGDEIDLTKFPSPRFYPLDGGRFIGTGAFRVERDPETGAINLGVSRVQLLDQRSLGTNIKPGKRGDRILKKYERLGKPMASAVILGCDPIYLPAGGAMVEAESEYDIAGAIRGVPAEVIISDLTGLPIPAEAEIVIEGEIPPDDTREEGPFGEFTGYYTDELQNPTPKAFVSVKRVLYRNNPILWANSCGRPVTDIHVLTSFMRTATLWKDLADMKIPGIQSVYAPPQSTGRFWAIVSVKQIYSGHADQVGSAVLSTTTGHYGIKGVIVVDDDIAADDLDRVFWALSVRYDPYTGTEIIKRGRASAFDPSPREDKEVISKIIINATFPFDWKDKPVEAKLDDEVAKRVKSQWKEYGLD